MKLTPAEILKLLQEDNAKRARRNRRVMARFKLDGLPPYKREDLLKLKAPPGQSQEGRE